MQPKWPTTANQLHKPCPSFLLKMLSEANTVGVWGTSVLHSLPKASAKGCELPCATAACLTEVMLYVFLRVEEKNTGNCCTWTSCVIRGPWTVLKLGSLMHPANRISTPLVLLLQQRATETCRRCLELLTYPIKLLFSLFLIKDGSVLPLLKPALSQRCVRWELHVGTYWGTHAY